MADPSFDVVCKVDRQEVQNALDLVRKEVQNRFDFKGATVEVELEKDHIRLNAPDKMKATQLIDMIQSRLVKRGQNLKAFRFGEFESNVSGIIKCRGEIQSGLTLEQTKRVTKAIKDSKLKVQAQIQGDAVRVSGKKKDDLQQVQAMLRNADLDFHLDFDNYR